MKRKKASGAGAGRKLPGIYTRGKTFWFTYRLAGKKHFHSLRTTDYADAVRLALEIRRTPELAPAEVFAREIKAFIAHKLHRNEYSDASSRAKPSELRAFAAHCGRANPTSVSTADAEAFYKHIQATRSESTAHGYMVTLRSFFNWLVETDKMRHNPAAAVKLARLDVKGRDKFCSAALRDKLIADCTNPDLKLVLFLGFHAGLRKNEIIQARPEWFDLHRGLLTVRQTTTFRPKDREQRTVPLTAALRAFLVARGLPGPFVLRPQKKSGKSIYRCDFMQAFRTYVGGHDFPWVTLHVMRHTFASLLASAGVSIYKVATWLGDDVRVVQKHYAKLIPDDGDIEKAFPKVPA